MSRKNPLNGNFVSANSDFFRRLWNRSFSNKNLRNIFFQWRGRRWWWLLDCGAVLKKRFYSFLFLTGKEISILAAVGRGVGGRALKGEHHKSEELSRILTEAAAAAAFYLKSWWASLKESRIRFETRWYLEAIFSLRDLFFLSPSDSSPISLLTHSCSFDRDDLIFILYPQKFLELK